MRIVVGVKVRIARWSKCEDVSWGKDEDRKME